MLKHTELLNLIKQLANQSNNVHVLMNSQSHIFSFKFKL